MQTPKWAVGMRRLGPGLYVKDGEMHVYAPEICAHFGVPPTPANLQIAEAAAIDVARSEWPDIRVQEVLEP